MMLSSTTNNNTTTTTQAALASSPSTATTSDGGRHGAIAATAAAPMPAASPTPIHPPTTAAAAAAVPSASAVSPTPSQRPQSTSTPPPHTPGQSREPQHTLPPPPTAAASPPAVAAAPHHQPQQHPHPHAHPQHQHHQQQQQQQHYAPHLRQLSHPRPHPAHLPLPGPPPPYMPVAHPSSDITGAKRTASAADLPRTNTTAGLALASGAAQPAKRQALQTSTTPQSSTNAATNTRRLSLTSGLGTPISAHPHTPVGGSTMTFPPAPSAPHQQYQPPVLPAPPSVHTLTDADLHGRSSEQLIGTILSMQSQHQQYVSHISAQYENINHQLSELRGSLQAFHGAQAASHQAAAAAISPREPLSTTSSGRPSGSLSHHQKRPSTSSSRNGHTRQFPTSPTSAHVLPRPGSQAQQSPGPPAYDYRTVGTVEEVWKEYKEGMDGQPAVEELDAAWGSRWRPEPRGRTWYSRRKVIWDKIKDFIAEGMDEGAAVQEVEKLRDGGTVNKLIRSLQDERKEKGPDELHTLSAHNDT